MSKPVNISYSSHSRFKECPEKYWLSKEYESVLIPSALVFGKCVETSIEALLLGKTTLAEALELFEVEWIKDKRDNPLMEYLKSDLDESIIFKDSAIKYELPENWETQLDDANLNKKVSWICCLIRGKTMIKAFHDKLLPKIKLLVKNDKTCNQIEINITNEDGDKVRGFLDFVITHEEHKGSIIVDLKTSGKPYTDDQLNKSEQLRTYIAVKGAEFNTRMAGYIVLVKKLIKIRTCTICKASPKSGLVKNCPKCPTGRYVPTGLDANIQFVCKEFNDDELQAQLDDYSITITEIKDGVRFKNKDGCFSFGRQCEFHSVCWENKSVEQIAHLKKKALTEETNIDKVKEQT